MESHTSGRRVRAIELRYVLTWYLHEHGPLTVAQLARALEEDALTMWGRPSKAISDALRWEVGRGRVVRLGRGRYGPGRIPRATAHRIRRRVEAIRVGELTSPWAY